MNNYTADLYEIKREINTYSNKLVNGLGKPEAKLAKQMIYGISKSGSCVLSDVSDALMEDIKKVNTVERLSRRLRVNLPGELERNYLNLVITSLPANPVILVDDTDIIKPYGEKFESLGIVRDGSSANKVYEKGYMVTEIVALTAKEKHPVSLFSHIHSSTEKNYKSTNTVLYSGLDKVIENVNGKPCFVFDRGFDMNALYNRLHKKNADFIVRIKENRKIFHKGKWFKATVLRDSRKGKIKTQVWFNSQRIDCYVSHLNVRLTSSKQSVRLLLVYGIGETPMMLITSKTVNSKEEAVDILRTYMSRWRIEEYFRFKKEEYGFENIRVRSLRAMNNINKFLSYAITFSGLLIEGMDRKLLAIKALLHSKAIKKKIRFWYYQMTKGIREILKHARRGIRDYLNIEVRCRHKQLSLFKC